MGKESGVNGLAKKWTKVCKPSGTDKKLLLIRKNRNRRTNLEGRGVLDWGRSLLSISLRDDKQSEWCLLNMER